MDITLIIKSMHAVNETASAIKRLEQQLAEKEEKITELENFKEITLERLQELTNMNRALLKEEVEQMKEEMVRFINKKLKEKNE